jgi:hypothetical protein
MSQPHLPVGNNEGVGSCRVGEMRIVAESNASLQRQADKATSCCVITARRCITDKNRYRKMARHIFKKE